MHTRRSPRERLALHGEGWPLPAGRAARALLALFRSFYFQQLPMLLVLLASWLVLAGHATDGWFGVMQLLKSGETRRGGNGLFYF